MMALPPVTPHLKAGTLRALAITTDKRVAAAPDVPTMKEAGVPGDQNSDVMQAVFVPAGTPKPIIDLLQKEIAKSRSGARRKVEARFSRLRSDRGYARAFRRAHKGGDAEVGESDRGGQDRKSEINKRSAGSEVDETCNAYSCARSRRCLPAPGPTPPAIPDQAGEDRRAVCCRRVRTDVMARLIAQKLSETLKQQFYVENHPGAGGNIGMTQVAKAAPDGYTMLVASSSFMVNPSLYAKNPVRSRTRTSPRSRWRRHRRTSWWSMPTSRPRR